MKDCILLTGATGALGSGLLRRFSNEGNELICLVRAKDRSAGRKRISAIVGERENVRVVIGDITEPRCGLSDEDCHSLVGRVKRVLNCAASINLQDKAVTQLTNIAGVHNVLQLTDILTATDFLHVSTAYVVGAGSHLAEQRLSDGRRWRNPYEESKFIGETIVHAWAAKDRERRYAIFRPSVLIGGEDGKTSTFDGHYRYFEPIHRAAETLRKRAHETLPPEIVIHETGLVNVPLVVIAADNCINYISIDWVADMIVAAAGLPLRNRTYNLVHHSPPRTRDCLLWSLDYLKVSGIQVCNSQVEKDIAVRSQARLVNRMQRRIDIVHDAYEPYCVADPHFEMTAASEDLGSQFRLPPIVNQAYLVRTLNYALQNKWQAKR